MTENNSTPNFDNLGLTPNLLQAIKRLNFLTPTPIQHHSIPLAISGADFIGIAQTGTGKTMAFGLPMLQRLSGTTLIGLILVPTRELAMQVEEALLKVAGPLGLRTALIIGGMPIYRQKTLLSKNPDIIIATPGRLIDHLKQRNVSLKNVGILVLDEADRMLDMGFAPQIKQILNEVPTKRQTMLFSATMPKELLQIAHSYMVSPLRIEVAQSGTTAEKVEQIFVVVNKADKFKELARLLRESNGITLVFTRTKHGASKLTKQLTENAFSASEIHSNRSLGQRQNALEGFKSGKYRILVATDIAARGIDVKNIETVVNFDLPDNPDDYVHRIGRTARAGKEGRAISFATPDQKKDVQIIERLIRQTLTVDFRVPFEESLPKMAYKSRPRRGGFRRR